MKMDPESRKSLVNRIITSQTFYNKEVLKSLLEFLHSATEKGLSLKEVDIAFDFFRRKDSFIPGDDTIVRVNIHKLRQLLGLYYLEEGKDDKIRIQIPKGSYALSFEHELPQANIQKKELSKIPVIILSVVLFISLLINVLFTRNVLKEMDDTNHPVWGTYLMSNKPVCIILGNPFFYLKKDSLGKNIICRDLEINSPEEFSSDLDKKLPESPYVYLSKNNILPLPDIIGILSENNKKLQIEALSDVNPEDLKNSNQVFIANINSFGFFSQYLDKTSIRIFTKPRKIGVLYNSDTVFYQVPENVGDYYNDYSFLVKIPGPNNNTITMIGDFHSSGNKGLADFLHNSSQIKSLNKYVVEKYGLFPNYFEMVVKVSSYHYSDVKTELIYFKKLEFDDQNKFSIPEMMN